MTEPLSPGDRLLLALEQAFPGREFSSPFAPLPGNPQLYQFTISPNAEQVIVTLAAEQPDNIGRQADGSILA